MRVLLDENLDHRLRRSLAAHEVFTASYKGWDGLKNGRLSYKLQKTTASTYSLPETSPFRMSKI